jgi:hypothetical protein
MDRHRRNDLELNTDIVQVYLGVLSEKTEFNIMTIKIRIIRIRIIVIITTIITRKQS